MNIDSILRFAQMPTVRGAAAGGDQGSGKGAPRPPALPERAEPQLLLPPPRPERNVRMMSPREVATFAYDNYIDGVLNWDEYRMLGFPAELHPAFDETIGALTGEKADPDRPRDVVADWEDRLAFARKHNPDQPEIIGRTERILDVLKWQEQPGISLQV